MALSATLRTQVATWLQTADTKLAGRQAVYFPERMRYRQFLRSHAVPPRPGSPVAPDRLSTQPHGEGDGRTLADANLGATWPVSIEVHVYDGPRGKGLLRIARCTGSAGEVWIQVRDFGPEGRDLALQQEVPA